MKGVMSQSPCVGYRLVVSLWLELALCFSCPDPSHHSAVSQTFLYKGSLSEFHRQEILSGSWDGMTWVIPSSICPHLLNWHHVLFVWTCRCVTRSPLAQMEDERMDHVARMKKMEQEMEQVFEMKVKEKLQKLRDSETEVWKTKKGIIMILACLFFVCFCKYAADLWLYFHIPVAP